ncbi:MAG: helix-turn-helix transcriptional regulator [Candidatus Nanoarchaeia archaeon]|jgi:plasmid maintenance system antidote protein VapI|nr:helix-turn-helix transcriptional regulator [Candidatus Nanoarchaeia archaeon]
MPRRIPDETKEKIIRLYDNGSGLSPAEIAKQTDISYSSVYGLTRAKQRVNPETGQPFESRSQYQEYTTKQRVNRPENQGLSELITRRLKELGKNQSWLAEEIGVTHQAVSLYAKGRTTPTDDLLQRLYSSLDVPYETLDDLLKDLY